LSAVRKCRLVFYGDDFTGATDALEVLTFAGLRSALFLKPPRPETLAQFAELDAAGVAGDSRAMSPAEMSAKMPAVFEAIATVGAPIVHYKVCSTFDSSPSIGSIGRIMEIARQQFAAGFIPIVAGTPALGRYCLFGNLFARSGTDGKVYRIDRHPIMSVHPVTPMTEGDLARHLESQGEVAIEKFLYPWFEEGRDAALKRLSVLENAKPDGILFDAASPPHLSEIGYLLAEEVKRRAPIFVVGGSGVEYALTQYWRESQGLADIPGRYDTFARVDRLLAVSGSASNLTAAQIEAALNAGFAEIPVVARDLLSDDTWRGAAGSLATEAVKLLGQGRSVLIHTARGADDPRIGEMIDSLVARGHSPEDARHGGGRELGIRLGEVVRQILTVAPLPRIAVAGGDTSSQVTQVLAPDALEVAARLSPGAPLCRTVSRNEERNGIEIALKGGQMGGVDFFDIVRSGRPS
jgi:3-oxoisoapionate kinase